MKGKLKEWVKTKGKDHLGKLLDTIGENTSIPVVSGIIEHVGESLMNDTGLSEDDKNEVSKIIKTDLDELKIREENLTKRWVADVSSDNKLAQTARPITLHLMSLLLISYFVMGYLKIYLPSEYTSLLIVLVPTVYGGYFALREFGKHSERKNKK